MVFAQETLKARLVRIASHNQLRHAILLVVGRHGAELQYGERPSATPYTLLAIDDRTAAAVQTQGDEQQQGTEQYQAHERDQEVEQALHRPLGKVHAVAVSGLGTGCLNH